MKIWVDADACPTAIRDIICRAAERLGITTTFVANQALRLPRSRHVRMLQVPRGFDVADHEIVGRVSAGDLVVTADIPLAAEVIEQGGHAINPRGEQYSPETIGARLNMRDFMDTLRASGIQSGGPPPLGQRERQDFANSLDRLLTRYLRESGRR
jgi:uncharacterized protein YaiI (UPF0178 family)